jgi:hypothetical protein
MEWRPEAMKTETLAIVAAIGIVTALIVAQRAAAGLANAGGAVVDYGAGLMTGNNGITAGARTTAYQGAGVLGTLGAATDAIFGGLLSQAGETIGGWAYDITH